MLSVAMVVLAVAEGHTKRQVGEEATVVPMVATGNLLAQIVELLVEPVKEQQPGSLVKVQVNSTPVVAVAAHIQAMGDLEAKAVGEMAPRVIVTKLEVAPLILGEEAEVLHFMKIKVLLPISILALVALG
nr:MAG TPA: hypothetical protein [Caudoviricetes sp.]